MSWKLFVAFGIPVRLHFSMLIIPLFLMQGGTGNGLESLLMALVLTVLLFGSVLLHEFGHALTGRRYGVHTEDIVLTPIGGMARMRQIPKVPKHEIIISLAGPLVSFALAGASFLLGVLSPFLPFSALWVSGAMVLFQVNLMLGLFNLIPAFPMDGGRVFRGLLARRYSYLQATTIAVRLGRGLAVVAGLYALYDGAISMAMGGSFGHISLLLISFFIYTAAGQEERMARMQAAREQAFATGWPFSGIDFGRPFNGGGQGGTQTVYQAQRSNVTPKVVTGGKVEVISRRDPS